MKARVTLGVLFLLFGAGLAWSGVTGSISGSVTDASGAVVPGATVVTVNVETGIQNSTQTNAQGFYSFPVLPPGHYNVKITCKGFSQFQHTGLVVDVNSALRVDATLQVGAVTQEVSVTATAAHVETSNTQMGEVIGATKMTRIPLNGRSYTDLLSLQPGVAPASSGASSGESVSGNLNPGNVSVSGERESYNGFMVNGGNVMEGLYMDAAVIPSLDSIAEFRILTNNADAEYGNFSGGLVNVITKSGTNRYHGSAFEFMRHPNLDARNFYSAKRSVLHQNQFGGTAGGPIRHDRVFFFADYQGTRMVQGVDTGLIPVPSVADRQGNLADIASKLTKTVKGGYWANLLSQELGYPVTPGEPYYVSGCSSTSQCVFPNAVIPQTAWTTPTKFLLKYIPLPNIGTNIFSTSAYKKTLGDNKGSGRLDANTRLGMLSGYYYIDDYVLVNPYGNATVPGFATTNNGRNGMINMGLTKSFGPSSVNELRLQYMRNVSFNGYPLGGVGPKLAEQGFNIYPMAPEIEGVQGVSFNSFKIGASRSISQRYDNIYQVLDNFSKVMGTHTIKYGGSFHYDQVTYKFWYDLNGSYRFNGVETGNDFADFLLGAPSTFAQILCPPSYARARYYGLYGQDSWRATRHLTVNYGLRWEVSTPWWEAHNQFETFVPGLQSKVFPGAPTGFVFPGDPGIPSTFSPTRYNNFGPRFGVAYSPETNNGFLHKLLGASGQSSIRAAWGMYYTAFEELPTRQEQGVAPYGLSWSAPTAPLFANPWIGRADGHDYGNRFPVSLPPLNVGPNNPDTSIDWSQFTPLGAYGWDIGNRVPYSEHYNISLQRQFGSSTILSLSYVGSQGHRLLGTIERNPGNPALCLSVSQVSQVTDGVTCGPAAEDGTYYPITGGVIRSTRPYAPLLDSGGPATMANSNYNALQASLRHTGGRLEFLIGYTYSKVLDNASGDGGGQGDNLNPVDHKITKALSAFDVTHNFVVSYNYRLPFEKLWHPNRLTSGWMLSGVTRFATGFPVFIQEPDDNSLLGTCNVGIGLCVDTPNHVPGDLKITDPRKAVASTNTNPYFNTLLFSMEPLGQLGTSSRRFFHGPGLNNWDLSLMKDLRLTESKSFEFRVELFNAFNHAQFGLPDGDILDSTFGFVTGAHAPRIGQVAIKFYF